MNTLPPTQAGARPRRVDRGTLPHAQQAWRVHVLVVGSLAHSLTNMILDPWGMTDVGKTSLLARFVEDVFPAPDPNPSIEMEYVRALMISSRGWMGGTLTRSDIFMMRIEAETDHNRQGQSRGAGRIRHIRPRKVPNHYVFLLHKLQGSTRSV